MKSFEEILKENHVRIPTRKRWEPVHLFERRKARFKNKWEEAEKAYLELRDTCFEMCFTPWDERCKIFLQHHYGFQAPNLESIPSKFTPVIKFKTPQEAKVAFENATRDAIEWGKKFSFRMVVGALRREWFFNTIMGNMPEGCELIVLKQKDYTPKNSNEAQFIEKAVQTRKGGYIERFFGLSIYWVAVKPDEAENCNFHAWKIDPLNHTVEYY